MTEACPGNYDTLVAIVNERIYYIPVHIRVIINDAYLFLKSRADPDILVVAALRIILPERGNLLSADHCKRDVSNGPEGGAVA